MPQGAKRTIASTIARLVPAAFYAWEFAKDDRELRVRVEGQLTFNTSYAMVDAAIAGYGIVYVPEDLVTAEIRSGSLM